MPRRRRGKRSPSSSSSTHPYPLDLPLHTQPPLRPLPVTHSPPPPPPLQPLPATHSQPLPVTHSPPPLTQVTTELTLTFSATHNPNPTPAAPSLLPRQIKKPTSSSGGEEDAEICVRTTSEYAGYNWFMLNTEITEENIFTRPNILPPNPHFGSSMAAVGSTIYAVGGLSTVLYECDCEVYSDVYYLYTTADGGCVWKQAPPMTRKRTKPYLVPLHDGRLLVIGGLHGGDIVFPFAEIYDPNTQTWTPSKTMPARGTVPTAFDGHEIFGNKVFLHFDCLAILCYYDIKQDLWETYSAELKPFECSSALIDGILYFLEYHILIRKPILHGFDFENFKSLPSSSSQTPPPLITQMHVEIPADIAATEWLPQREEDFSYPIVHLLALGSDKLALVWNPEFANIDMEGLVIYVSIFQMIKMNTPNGDKPKNVVAMARPLYQRRYQLEGMYLFDCVAVFSSRKVESHEDLPYDNNIGRNGCKMKQLDEEKRVRKKKKKRTKRNIIWDFQFSHCSFKWYPNLRELANSIIEFEKVIK